MQRILRAPHQCHGCQTSYGGDLASTPRSSIKGFPNHNPRTGYGAGFFRSGFPSTGDNGEDANVKTGTVYRLVQGALVILRRSCAPPQIFLCLIFMRSPWCSARWASPPVHWGAPAFTFGQPPFEKGARHPLHWASNILKCGAPVFKSAHATFYIGQATI